MHFSMVPLALIRIQQHEPFGTVPELQFKRKKLIPVLQRLLVSTIPLARKLLAFDER